jgi:hypothetical protein
MKAGQEHLKEEMRASQEFLKEEMRAGQDGNQPRKDGY